MGLINFLQNLAGQVQGGFALGNHISLIVDAAKHLKSFSEEDSQAYGQFLSDLLQETMISSLQAIMASGGNVQKAYPLMKQKVYPLLKENTDKLDDKLAELLWAWATTTLEKAKPNEAKSLAAVILLLSKLIQEFPLGNKARNMEIAINGCEIVLTVFTRDAFPYEWAMAQNNLAAAYLYRIRGERAENLERAIACCQEALKVRTVEAFPADWAMTYNNLAMAYAERIRGERAENLEQAIACYKEALKVYTFKAFPYEWARVQNNLAVVYRNRIRGNKAENLKRAIACYQNALKIRTFDTFPQQWATTQNNLAAAYSDSIGSDKAGNLERAIACLQESLTVRTFEAFPYEWARTQNNLAIAYRDRIRGDKAENLDRAIICYQNTLKVYNINTFPIDWAQTQNNLAVAYSDRIRGDKAENLEQAIFCLQEALKVRTFEAFPVDWAQVQINLATAYRNRIREDKAGNLEQAITCCLEALKVYTFEAFPVDWAMTQNNLANAYSNRIKGDKAENLEQAIFCLQEALKVSTFEAFPVDWATKQNNLAAAYLERIRGDKAENLERVIAFLQEALKVYTFEAFPVDWASIQSNLGEAYRRRIRGDRAENLERAIAAYQKALTIRTSEAFPQNHAETLAVLGITYQKTNQFTLAYTTFKSTIDTVESLREEIVSGQESKRKQAEYFNPIYSCMVEVCLKLSKNAEAIKYVERSKTRNLVEQILSRDLKTIFPSDVVNQLEQYRDDIAAGHYQIQHSKAENPKVLAQHLQELRQQRNELQDKYLPIGSSFDFENFQKKLDDHTAIVEFYITSDKLLTFIFTHQRNLSFNNVSIKFWLLLLKINCLAGILFLREYPIVLQSQPKDLDKLVQWRIGYLRAYNNHKTWERGYPKSSKESPWQCHLNIRLDLLAKILQIDGIIQQIPPECDRLILVPHQVLHLFPLHALPINSQQGKAKSEILMHRFPAGVSYAPSCQLLELAQTRKRPKFTHLFAIQNPTSNLEYADIEVETVQNYFNSANTDVLVEKDATKAAIDSKPLNTFHCIHFSCHGYFNYNKPGKSALQLADAQLNPAPAELNPEQHLVQPNGRVIDLDKWLTLDAVFDLKLEQCRLVTLSACETGLIDFTNISDEYIGLPSGFLVAGSPAVVSSLWSVNEISTALLMIKFYENLQKQMSLGVALNQAQLWLRDATKEELQQWTSHLPLSLENQEQLGDLFYNLDSLEKPYQKPYHWAAFCAIGQ